MYYENVNVLSDQTFLKFVSKKVNNTLEINSVRSALNLYNKIIPYSIILLSMEWILYRYIGITEVFQFNLWNYSLQGFLVGFPSLFLSTDHWNPTILVYNLTEILLLQVIRNEVKCTYIHQIFIKPEYHEFANPKWYDLAN